LKAVGRAGNNIKRAVYSCRVEPIGIVSIFVEKQLNVAGANPGRR
jgi:hypothetical protein